VKEYKKKGTILARPYIKGENLAGVSVSERDDPENDLGMIAQNPKDEKDRWYINSEFFRDNYETLNCDSVYELLDGIQTNVVRLIHKKNTDRTFFLNAILSLVRGMKADEKRKTSRNTD
jgi:hypothetical protein